MRKRQSLRDEAGFSLAELLVSTVVTLMVLGAALGTFTDATRVSDAAREASDTNLNLQVAMSMMVRDFIQTGRGIPIGGIPIPSGGGAVALNRPAPPGAALTFPAGNVVLPAVSPGASLGPVVLGVNTDLVTVLYEDATLNLSAAALTAIAADGSSMTVDAGTDITGPDGIRVGDLILFRNGLGNALQAVTGTDGGQTVFFAEGDELNLNQRGAPQGTIMQLQSAPDTYPPTFATRVVMVTYYIDTFTDPALPRLVRQANNGDRLAIALGIENYQITFDLVDGTTNPTNVEDPQAPNSPHQIRKVNLFLAGRSIQVNQRTRQFFRNTMATQVGLRSLSFVDRYQ